ncbi:MAG: hypothetical protein IT308_11455 [Anaerolineaceae bacterium]|nr:hypothetical protein [Anaerolineaceae bacterium]
MDVEERTELQPVLAASPQHLQFGDFDTEKLPEELPSATLTITNPGINPLAGRISPQVSWIQVDPPDFSCQSGETSQHTVTLTPETPHAWQNRLYSYEYLLLLNSNGGSFFIGGSYTAKGPPLRTAKSTLSLKHWVIPFVVVILLAAVLTILFFAIPWGEKQPASPDILFTQGAQTVIAVLTQTAAVQPSPQATTSSVMVSILPRTPVPHSAEAAHPLPNTPWPRAEYPNPEQFIKDYYREVNNRNYEKSWSMLTQKFQQSCCSVAGNDPYQIYINWWNTIERVEVITAYIQAWDTNPAEVYTVLQYLSQKGESSEVFNIYRVVADPDKKDLKIDEVR